MLSKFIITSPNPRFTKIIKDSSKELSFDSIIIVEAILEDAVDEVMRYVAKYDITAIISRGSTAAMIRERTNIPILYAEASSYDILLAIIEAMSISKEVAYVNYTNNIEDNSLSDILNLLNIKVKLFYFSTKADLEKAIHQAYIEGFKVIVSGSRNAEEFARSIGLSAVTINTSENTMRELIKHAETIQYIQKIDYFEKNRIKSVLNIISDGILYLDYQNIVTLINKSCLDLLKIDDEKKIIGKSILEFISNYEFEDIISGKNINTEKAITILDQNVVIKNAPVFEEENYIGTVINIKKSSEITKLDREIRMKATPKNAKADATFYNLENTTCSSSMIELIKRAKLYAKTNNTIMITGESGTGKEMLAQSIHNASSRHNEPFFAINCASIPENLLQSELFGYEEGAFTGAKQGGKPGYFELAHNGTLFLDELGLLPLNVQTQLLRVLQERQVLRIGGNKFIPINIRIVAATNTDLFTAVLEGKFRQDLYYRINVLNLSVPPLRERKNDIPLLLNHYLSLYSSQYNKNIKYCSNDLLDLLKNYDWPGNIRELMNYTIRMVIQTEDEEINSNDLRSCGIKLINDANKNNYKENQVTNSNVITLNPDSLKDMEYQIINWFMNYHNGSKMKVCQELGISRTTLWKKLKA